MNSTNNRVTTPPSVIHQWADDRPFGQDAIDAIIDRVTENANLTKNESNLLRFYAKCGGGKQGFPAALKLVLNRTGIADKKGWRRSRRKLEELNLITYRNDGRGHFIRVNWRDICELATSGNKVLKGIESFRESVPLYQKAVEIIADQPKLSKDEFAHITAILSLLPVSDLEKITAANFSQRQS